MINRGRQAAETGGLVVLAAITVALVLLASSQTNGRSTSVTSNPPLQTDSAPDPTPAVLWIGDSWVGGSDMGGVDESNFTAITAEKLGWYSQSNGVGGTGYLSGIQQDPKSPDRSLQYTDPERLNEIGTANRSDVVVVVNGVNDLDLGKHQDPLSEIPAAAALAYEGIKSRVAPGAHVVVIGYIPTNTADRFLVQANSLLRNEAQKVDFSFIDPSRDPWFVGVNQRFIGTDNFHLTNAGHKHLADVITRQLEKQGARQWVSLEGA